MQKMMQKYRANTFTKNRANDAKIQSQHVHKKRANDEKKRRNSTAQPELGFLLGPITTFFHGVSGERAAEHNR